MPSACQALRWAQCLTPTSCSLLSLQPGASAGCPGEGQSPQPSPPNLPGVCLCQQLIAGPSTGFQIEQFRKHEGSQVPPAALMTSSIALLSSSLLWYLPVNINFLPIPLPAFQPSSNRTLAWENKTYYRMLKVINNFFFCCMHYWQSLWPRMNYSHACTPHAFIHHLNYFWQQTRVCWLKFKSYLNELKIPSPAHLGSGVPPVANSL